MLAQPPPTNQFSSDEIVDAGHHFFNGVSRGLASIVEKAASQWGQPNGYILGEEAGGAFIGGCATEMAPCTQRMQVAYACSGRGLRDRR